MDQLKVKDRILENISLSVKKLQSYFAACEDETPAIRNHDRVLQRLCEHLDHALLYGLQDISSGYWVLVLHFTRREAVRQIDELQHIATNLGRSRAWLYLALSESSLESYLRLFQENQGLLQKYYFKNALVCSHDHLTLFLTLVSGLEFIRFDLELDVPYLDVAPYMPEYYKPQNLLDFEERLPSSDSLSLHSFTSLTSTNLEWDDSAIAPSSEDYDFGDIFPVLQSLPSADWEEGDLTDQASCPRSSGSDPQTVISDTVVLSAGAVKVKVAAHTSPHSPTSRHNPFNEDSDTNTTNTSADVTPVHVASRHNASATGDDTESTSNELEVIRMARRRKPAKKRRGKGSTDSSSSIHNSISSDHMEMDNSLLALEDVDSLNCTVIQLDGEGELRRSRVGSEAGEEADEDGVEGLLRLPEMTDTSMDSEASHSPQVAFGPPLTVRICPTDGPGIWEDLAGRDLQYTVSWTAYLGRLWKAACVTQGTTGCWRSNSWGVPCLQSQHPDRRPTGLSATMSRMPPAGMAVCSPCLKDVSQQLQTATGWALHCPRFVPGACVICQCRLLWVKFRPHERSLAEADSLATTAENSSVSLVHREHTTLRCLVSCFRCLETD
ncbi:pleckstrin homology domain-containing family M member 2 isoform X1 [Lates japonicus]|uniref:Pleckstrin homology domain-containing family M member 2 isoform X1 n=1 Tax=Lates japonicus TaxID=270547 RepID=A0AAD3NHG2_LATJO|nr:pleckstrin homology domain-containing family M member 2 isoform X1 [Lates japonicus]